MIFKRKKKSSYIAPEETLLDASNLPDFETDQFEGRIVRPLSKKNLLFLGGFFVLLALVFAGRAWFLQINNGQALAKRSADNQLRQTYVFAQRGNIADRNGTLLAWNTPGANQFDFSLRNYSNLPGLSDLLGFVKYPSKDKNGVFYTDSLSGKDGVEKYYDSELAGKNGMKMVEVNAENQIQSQGVVQPAESGNTLKLSIDSNVQSELYDQIAQAATLSGFAGGAGVIMDVHTGQILALTTYPEYNSQVMTDGTDTVAISSYLTASSEPMLDRAVSGLYAPGSIVKPFIALGALNEGVITPDKQILSTGQIELPNPYSPSNPSIFRDWQANGWCDMDKALAMSSDVYFYEVGGGYQDQKGLGITNIDKYTSMFGFGQGIPGAFFDSTPGVVPSPAWKAENFTDGVWRVGDTYHSAIGQFGWQVTPLQAVRAVAAVANGGTLLEPTLINDGSVAASSTHIAGIPAEDYDVVRAGMREAVLSGTVQGLNIHQVDVASKTGTAEIGTKKAYINSLVTGFWPYENPKYAFAIVMEDGPAHYAEGATTEMRNLLLWMSTTTPQYLQ
jgi:penicillin-binding protein 2